MIKQIFATLSLLLALLPAHADNTLKAWQFSYTGGLRDEGWDPNWIMHGTFSGRDLNDNGQIERSELQTFVVDGWNPLACTPTEYSECGVTFLLKPGGNLRFSAYYSGSDPEGWIGSSYGYSSYGGEHYYHFTPAGTEGFTVGVTFNTLVSVTPLPNPLLAPVPEPQTWSMLAAGLLALLIWGQVPNGTRARLCS